MKLWLLEMRENLPRDDNPWNGHYYVADGFVVRAIDELQARSMAQQFHGDEATLGRPVWTEERYTTCVELTTDGEASVLLLSGTDG
jgi:hypothetical protein